jgi:hypothetical protein
MLRKRVSEVEDDNLSGVAGDDSPPEELKEDELPEVAEPKKEVVEVKTNNTTFGLGVKWRRDTHTTVRKLQLTFLNKIPAIDISNGYTESLFYDDIFPFERIVATNSDLLLLADVWNEGSPAFQYLPPGATADGDWNLKALDRAPMLTEVSLVLADKIARARESKLNSLISFQTDGVNTLFDGTDAAQGYPMFLSLEEWRQLYAGHERWLDTFIPRSTFQGRQFGWRADDRKADKPNVTEMRDGVAYFKTVRLERTVNRDLSAFRIITSLGDHPMIRRLSMSAAHVSFSPSTIPPKTFQRWSNFVPSSLRIVMEPSGSSASTFLSSLMSGLVGGIGSQFSVTLTPVTSPVNALPLFATLVFVPFSMIENRVRVLEALLEALGAVDTLAAARLVMDPNDRPNDFFDAFGGRRATTVRGYWAMRELIRTTDGERHRWSTRHLVGDFIERAPLYMFSSITADLLSAILSYEFFSINEERARLIARPFTDMFGRPFVDVMSVNANLRNVVVSGWLRDVTSTGLPKTLAFAMATCIRKMLSVAMPMQPTDVFFEDIALEPIGAFSLVRMGIGDIQDPDNVDTIVQDVRLPSIDPLEVFLREMTLMPLMLETFVDIMVKLRATLENAINGVRPPETYVRYERVYKELVFHHLGLMFTGLDSVRDILELAYLRYRNDLLPRPNAVGTNDWITAHRLRHTYPQVGVTATVRADELLVTVVDEVLTKNRGESAAQVVTYVADNALEVNVKDIVKTRPSSLSWIRWNEATTSDPGEPYRAVHLDVPVRTTLRELRPGLSNTIEPDMPVVRLANSSGMWTYERMNADFYWVDPNSVRPNVIIQYVTLSPVVPVRLNNENFWVLEESNAIVGEEDVAEVENEEEEAEVFEEEEDEGEVRGEEEEEERGRERRVREEKRGPGIISRIFLARINLPVIEVEPYTFLIKDLGVNNI